MAGTTPLVSIILPTYNGAAYLREAIDSCLAQTYANWELIVVDDCSVDTTPQIIADYVARDARIRSIRHEINRKLPEALNTGHIASKGSYISWTSDDNRLLPTALEEMLTFLQHNPEVALVYADCMVIDENGRFVQNYPSQPASALAYLNAVGPCFLYRRSVYQAVGAYDTGLLLAEDYDYWLRIYRQFEIAPLHRVLYEYRRHGQSLTNTAAGSSLQASVERTLRRNLNYLTRASRPDRARGWIVCAAAAMRRRDLVKTTAACLAAIRTDPFFSVRYLARRLAQKGFRNGLKYDVASENLESDTSPMQKIH
jgi:glycosyltransferase involved in cell wall biosynthesis